MLYYNNKQFKQRNKKMIDYNLILYIGITLIVGGFVLFFVAQHYERKAEIELFKLEQLNKSFNKNKNKK
jgi:hypothetical protein